MEEFVSIDKASIPRLGRREFVKAAAGTSFGLSTGCRPDPDATNFRSDWHGSRTWIGEQYWANPLQGWRVDGGEVAAHAGAGRTLHLLTHQANASHGGFEMEVTVRLASSGAGEAATEQTWAGFAFGIRGGLPGYQHALVHPATGLTAGLRSDGRVFCGESLGGTVPLDSPVRLKLTVRDGEPRRIAKISAQPLPDGPPAEVAVAVEADALPGNLALAAQGGGRPRAEASAAEWGFRDWTA